MKKKGYCTRIDEWSKRYSLGFISTLGVSLACGGMGLLVGTGVERPVKVYEVDVDNDQRKDIVVESEHGKVTVFLRDEYGFFEELAPFRNAVLTNLDAILSLEKRERLDEKINYFHQIEQTARDHVKGVRGGK